MIDRMSEVYFIAVLHQLHDSIWTVMRGEMEITWNFVNLNLAF